MTYALLAVTIAAEIVATIALKYSDGFTRFWPSALCVVGYLVSFAVLSQVLKGMSVGTAYAIWSAAGTAIIAAFGIVVLGESASLVRLLAIASIVGGVVALSIIDSKV